MYVSHAVFEDNTAATGGGIYAGNQFGTSGLVLFILDSGFERNTARAKGSGGEAQDSYVGSGGAVFAHAAYTMVAGSSLGGNDANKGGGLFW